MGGPCMQGVEPKPTHLSRACSLHRHLLLHLRIARTVPGAADRSNTILWLFLLNNIVSHEPQGPVRLGFKVWLCQ